MDESHFGFLLHAAKTQPEPQRLLFVFAAAMLPADANADQQARFEAGEGGELEPVMCVDKDPRALTTFDALVAESRHAEKRWHVVFVAGLSGTNRSAPSELQTNRALHEMVDAVRHGTIGRFAAYDLHGAPLRFS
jgi:hypothetical protein